MQGIINVLKPPGMTSHDVVSFLRRLTGLKKIGHGGTLDPAAAGVLPVFIGKATKAIEFFENNDKQYIAELTLGITTDTGDVQGNVIKRTEANVNERTLRNVIGEFVGNLVQTPPMYSAVRYKGKKLYELARQGITVPRTPRLIEIYSIDLLYLGQKTAIIKVSCSKGTYIRTLCEDIGNRLKLGAYVSCLIRTQSGPFKLQDAHTLEEIQEAINKDEISKILISVSDGLKHFPAVEIELQKEEHFFKGAIFFPKTKIEKTMEGELIRLFYKNRFMGIAKLENRNNEQVLRIIKVLS